MHVPEENLPKYRRLAELAFLMNRMGGMVSGLGQYEDANKLWAMGGKYKKMANELRVPGRGEHEQETDGQVPQVQGDGQANPD